MKKKLLLFVVSAAFTITINAQSWLGDHTLINIPNVPSTTPLSSLIGVNISNAIGSGGIPNPGVLKSVRHFHHMEIDYNYNFFPSEGELNPNTCDCSNTWCNAGGCNDIVAAGGTKSGFSSLKGFYCAWKSPAFGFTEMYATLESLFPKAPYGGCPNSTIQRGYPNKWYSLSEFGGLSNTATNFKRYIKAYLTTHCPNDLTKPALVNVLEIGNEPWGDPYPGKDGYHRLLIGAVAACREIYGTNNPANWRIKLSLAAFTAYSSNSDPSQPWTYVDVMIPDSLKPYFSYSNIHNYAFSLNTSAPGASNLVGEHPESDNGYFLAMKNMVAWTNQKMPHAKVNITEFGWNAGTNGGGCNDLGESSQAAYMIRAYFLAARYGINRAFAYKIIDSYEPPYYCTNGFYKDLGNNVTRKTFKSIQTINNSALKDARFLKALTENSNQANLGANGVFVYLFGDANGVPTHIVAWKPLKLGFEDNSYPTVSSSYETITLPSPNMTVSSGSNYFYTGWDNSQNGSVANSATGTVYVNGTTANSVNVKLSGMPIVIPINANGCSYNNAGSLNGCPTSIIESNVNQYGANVYYSSENGMINIQTGNYTSNVNVNIYDMMGRIVNTSSYIANGTHSFEFNTESSGIYMVEVMLNDGSRITKKIITK